MIHNVIVNIMLNPDIKSVKWKLTHCCIMNMNYLCSIKRDKYDTV